MKKHEIAYVSDMAPARLNDVIKKREENGWTLVPPILLKESRFDKYNNPLFNGCFILTFEKED